MNAPAPAPSYLGLVRDNPDFRRLWFGELISFFGDWFRLIALYTIVQRISDSALAVSAVVVATTLPVFLVTPVAGPIIDRFDRRAVLLATDVLRAGLVAGLIAAHHLESLPLLYGTLVLMVACTGVFRPARTAVIPQITSRAELPVAMALSGGTWSVMLAFGAAAGGAVTSWIGVDGALLLDAVTYLASFAFLWGLPALPPDADHGDGSEAGFFAGLRYLRRKPYLLSVLCHKPALGLAGASIAMLPIFGKDVFTVGGPLFIGLLYSMRGLGAVVGSMGTRRVVGDAERTMARTLVPAYGVMVLGFATAAWSPSFGLAALGFFVAAIGQATIWVFSGTLAQHASDSAFRGRIFSLEFGILTLMTSTSSVLGGWAVDAGWLTVRGVVAGCGVAMVVPALAWALALPALWTRREEARGGRPSPDLSSEDPRLS